MMFQRTSSVNITESLFTGLNIVVSKTETVKDSEFNEILNFLNSELNIFDTNDLVSDFISSGEFDWFRERIHFSSKLRLGPTQILWNSEDQLTGHEHILNTSKALNSLKEANTSSYFSDSTLHINYISEKKYKELPNLFYKRSTIASLIVDRQTDIFSLVDLFYSKKDKYNDKVPFHFLLTRSELVSRLVDEFDKYIVKENLHKYRKYNAEDDDFIHDCFVFVKESGGGNEGTNDTVDIVNDYGNDGSDNNATASSINDTNSVHSALKEIVLNILTSFLSQLATYFSNEAYSLESIKKYILKPITHLHLSIPKKSSLKVNSVYNGANVRLYGELYLLLNKKELAINYYTLSSYLFNAEGSDLEYCRTLFALSIVIFSQYLGKLAADVGIAVSLPADTSRGNEYIYLDSDNYHAIGTVGIDVANESIDANADDQPSSRTLENIDVTTELDINNIKIKYDKYDKYRIDGLTKDVGEKPLNYLLFYLNKSYKLWINTSDNSPEVELLFTFYLSILFKIKSPFISKVINSFVIYSSRVFTKEHQCNILKYIISLLSKSKYKRKLLFYRYLLNKLVNDSKIVDAEQREYKYKDINYVIYNLVSAVYNGLNDKKYKSSLDGLNFVEYDHWYQIKNTIIECEIVKLVCSSFGSGSGITGNKVDAGCLSRANNEYDKQELNKKVNKLVLMKYMNMFDYLTDLKYSVDLTMLERIIRDFVDSPNHFMITHFILLSHLNGACNPISNTNKTTPRGDNSYVKSLSGFANVNTATGTSTPSFGSVTVNRDDTVNDTSMKDDSDMGNEQFGFLDKMNKRGSSVHFIGGFEDLQFNNFPIAYSIKLQQDNYNYQHSNVKKVEHEYPSPRKRSSYNILVKGSYKHFKIKPVYVDHVIEPKCVIMNRRLCIIYRCEIRKSDVNFTSRKRYKRTSNSNVSDSDGVNTDNVTTANDGITDTGNLSVDNGTSITSGIKKKYVEYVYDKVDKVVYVDKELSVEVKLDNPLPVCLVLKNVRLITIGVSFDSEYTEIEVPPFKRNFKQKLKIVIGETGVLHIIGISFLLFEKLQCYQLLFKDAHLVSNLLTRYETDDEFQDNLKSDTGLMDLLKKSAVLELNAVNNYNKSRLDVYFTDFNNFYTDNRFGNFYSIGSSRRTTNSSRVTGKISLNSSIYDSARSNMSRLTRSISTTSGVVGQVNRRTSIASSSARRSSINTIATSNNPSIVDIDSIKSDMISWLRVPKFGQGTVLRPLKLCMSYSCSYCNIFYSYYGSLSASSRGDSVSINGAGGNSNDNNNTLVSTNTDDHLNVSNNANVDMANMNNISVDGGDNTEVDGLINGEIKLIYIRLKNENKNHSFTNLKITALPYYTTESQDHDVIDSYKNQVYGGKKRKIKNITIGGDYVEEKLKKNRLKNIKQQFYSKFIIILSEHCQLIRSNGVDCHDIRMNNYEYSSGVTVPPNETLYVPIIYKCNNIINNFNVILDYTIVKVSDSSADDNTNSNTGGDRVTTKRGYVHRNVKVKVKKSLEINNIMFENMVYFNLKHFIHNSDEFVHLFKQSTLSSLKKYMPIFDHKCVKTFINIVNKSEVKFNCVINRTSFVSEPNYTQRWSVKMRRIDYNKDVDLHEFTQMVLAHLQVKWTCDLNHIGVTNVYNLSDQDNYKLYTSRSYNNLTANSFNFANSWSYSGLGWRRPSVFERVIIKNMNNLIMSKLTIQLSVSTNAEMGSTKGTFDTNTGSKFTVTVLVKNNGYEPVNDYKVVIIPYNKECYTKTTGMQYTGCLEQIGVCPIIGLSSDSTDTTCNGILDAANTDSEHTVNRYTNDWDYYLKVASVEFVINEPGTVGINAAIISQNEKTIYWHHNPLTINVN